MSNDENAIALGSLAELIAKCGAAMCIGALCTAFVFDYTLWLIVDPRMLSYFDLVDHIQTAVQIFGIGSIALASDASFIYGSPYPAKAKPRPSYAFIRDCLDLTILAAKAWERQGSAASRRLM